ncbi:aspartyl/asparaginyl beta-hydroxylase domain-containing protein [Sphingomonas sp. GlSt437]|uniref:aspartyl/asparaginyl beta-hydroxylase domain-containing protein n=1 Tax=Sphingomonas sp. GlSt437 TaxID=3389970 RepID=UPI003A8364F1
MIADFATAPGDGQQASALPDRKCLAPRFDVDALVADLATITGSGTGWTPHFVSANYAGDWSAIPLRAPAGETHPIRQIFSDPTATDWVDTPALAAAPAIRAVIGAIGDPVQSVRLMRLAPGSAIHRHHDHDLAAEEGHARLHVPITTNPKVRFLLNDVAVPMQPGELWYLRLADPHEAVNAGTTDRVHLVIDIIAGDWLRGLLTR